MSSGNGIKTRQNLKKINTQSDNVQQYGPDNKSIKLQHENPQYQKSSTYTALKITNVSEYSPTVYFCVD